MPRPELVVPIRGANITAALAVARSNEYAFRHDEMDWIRDHNHFFYDRVTKIFAGLGASVADPYLAGTCLGHNAVRLCQLYPAAYEIVNQNFQQNNKTPNSIISNLRTDSLTLQQELDDLFGDPDLTSAFMEIRSGDARVAAATAVAYFCLKNPTPDTAQ